MTTGETKFTWQGNAAQTFSDMQKDSLQVGDSGGPQVREDMILQISAEQVCLAVQAQSGQATEDPEELAIFRFKGPICETLMNVGIRGWLEQSCIYREEYAIQCWETRPMTVSVASWQAKAFYRAVAAKLQEEASALNEPRSQLCRQGRNKN